MSRDAQRAWACTVIAHDPYAPEEKARALGVKLAARSTRHWQERGLPIAAHAADKRHEEHVQQGGVRQVQEAAAASSTWREAASLTRADLVEAVESGQVRLQSWTHCAGHAHPEQDVTYSQVQVSCAATRLKAEALRAAAVQTSRASGLCGCSALL